VDPMTGERHEAELFVAVLGASNYPYAEAVDSQKVGDWIGCHTRALKYFCGAAQVVVPDQLKSGVTRSCRYEPEIQRTYEEWSHHYATVIIPARPAHPRDKDYASHCTSSGRCVVTFGTGLSPRRCFHLPLIGRSGPGGS